MADDRDNQYLTPSQVAEALHVSPKTVSRWASQGNLPCLVTLGGHRRFRRHDVENALRQMAGPQDTGPAGGLRRLGRPHSATSA